MRRYNGTLWFILSLIIVSFGQSIRAGEYIENNIKSVGFNRQGVRVAVTCCIDILETKLTRQGRLIPINAIIEDEGSTTLVFKVGDIRKIDPTRSSDLTNALFISLTVRSEEHGQNITVKLNHIVNNNTMKDDTIIGEVTKQPFKLANANVSEDGTIKIRSSYNFDSRGPGTDPRGGEPIEFLFDVTGGCLTC